jgi:hypothetical protein
METSNINIRYWALYSHIYSYFEQGGTIKNAFNKYKELSDVVLYFYKFYLQQK